MVQAMFKGAAVKEKVTKKAKKTLKPTDAKQVGKRETGRNQIKKNRQERRKDIKKAQRKTNRIKMRLEKEQNRQLN